MSARSFSVVAAVALITATGCGTLAQPQMLPSNGSLEPSLEHKGSATETVLYSFGSHTLDGLNPEAGLIDVKGTLYGATYSGGAHRSGRICSRDHGCGTVFSITPSGIETVLYSFIPGGLQGANPPARLTVISSRLYGTTAYGGANECEPGYGCGAIFSITTSGAEKVLHRFNGSNGELPQAGLVYLNGMFYGTTAVGGASGYGTVFSITLTGTYHLLYSFAGGSDGQDPDAALINVNGKLYGTTSGGGKYGNGTVFSVTTSGSEKVLHSFAFHEGRFPEAGLTNLNGKLYGTTIAGGHSGGVVFSITTTGTEKVLHQFAGGSDGAQPMAELVNVDGTLYGTTELGGGAGCGSSGCGTVFSITPSGVETVLHSFAGESAGDGAYPQAKLVDLNGTIYGTTAGGGTYGYGTVFSLTGF
jgi:uncharacterized repeat protein (TIGR03803 family)